MCRETLDATLDGSPRDAMVEFTADSLTRPVALDVGRATFHVLGYLEWALTVTLAVLVWRTVATRQRPSERVTGPAPVPAPASGLPAGVDTEVAA